MRNCFQRGLLGSKLLLHVQEKVGYSLDEDPGSDGLRMSA